MSALNFNDAEPQRGSFDLIPDDTICMVVASLRPGGHGPGNWLKNNRDGTCLMADFEFTIDGGEYDKRKFWSMFVTEGETDGQQKAAAITRSRLRAMLESAYGVNPADDSAEAQAKRQVAGWQGFDGLRFCARIGIEKGKGEYLGKDKNVLKAAVTPDEDGYISPGGGAASVASTGVAPKTTSAAASSAKPNWAK